MKRVSKLLVLLVMGLFVLGVAGCGQEGATEGSALSGTIKIAGSTSVQPLSDALAEAFMAKNPGVKVNVAGGGSGAGIRAAQEGTADIGASSRKLKPEEEAGLYQTKIAMDGIAVVVHPGNPVSNLTMEQVKKIFAGEIESWDQVGGNKAPINVVTREAGSGTRGTFEDLVMGEGNAITPNAVVQTSNGAVRTAVAGDPNAVGYLSLGAVNEQVKALKIDGVEATRENVLSGSYKISRPFLYLTKTEPQGIIKSFIDFALSPEGQQIVATEWIPVK